MTTELLQISRADAFDFFARLTTMPSCSHWPDRSQPHTDANSEVIAHIMKLYDVDDLVLAKQIFVRASQPGIRAIRFDQETKLWRGNAEWRPDFARLGMPNDIFSRKTKQQKFLEQRARCRSR